MLDKILLVIYLANLYEIQLVYLLVSVFVGLFVNLFVSDLVDTPGKPHHTATYISTVCNPIFFITINYAASAFCIVWLLGFIVEYIPDTNLFR